MPKDLKYMLRLLSDGVFHQKSSLSEKCPNTELFLVRIFACSDWIRTHSDWTQSE